MKEKKDSHSKAVSGELARTFHEILIADKRSYEPFVKVFSAVGENVSKLDLGTLIGVFEVDEKSEDAAYIVNFLASVAKKEYFNNPRRGPIESFEAALHKVNVALAELVKHGNVSWLGKLHGALGVLEKNNLHFSATGEAAFLLLRQEQFSEISVGLASSEAEVHPLKTFVEVSSGRLMEDDLLILTTPELLALFPLEYLTKQALRMNHDAFRQFLRTALVNEIDMAAVLAIEFNKAIPNPKTVPGGAKKSTPHGKGASALNAWSQATFQKEKTTPAPEAPTLEEEKNDPVLKEEFIDQKTGHIYVQGEELDGGSQLKHSVVVEKLQELSTYSGELFSRTLRRQGKKTARFGSFLLWAGRTQATRLKRKIAQKAHLLATDLAAKNAERIAKQERQKAKMLRIQAEQKKSSTPIVPPSEVTSTLPHRQENPKNQEAAPIPVSPAPTRIQTPQKTAERATSHIERLRSLYEGVVPTPPQSKPLATHQTSTPQQNRISVLAVLTTQVEQFRLWCTNTFRSLKKVLITLPHKKYIGLALVILICGGLFGFWLIHTTDSPATQATTEASPSNPPAPTPAPTNSNTLKADSTSSTKSGLVGLVFLSNQGYGATPKSVVAIDSNQEFTVPDMKGEIRFLAPMQDLGLLFILSSQNELFAWSPLNKTFTRNELSLPENTRVTGMGTYLTYLYVLDRGNNQLYRYPRAENGFKEATNWMKESFELTDTAFLAINETVALAPSREHLLSFSQGKNTGVFVESDDTHQVALQALATDNDSPFIYALDDQKTLSIWNLDRKLTHQYTLSDMPDNAQFIAVDPGKNTLLVGNKEGVITRYINVISE